MSPLDFSTSCKHDAGNIEARQDTFVMPGEVPAKRFPQEGKSVHEVNLLRRSKVLAGQAIWREEWTAEISRIAPKTGVDKFQKTRILSRVDG
jgi:hypothetical protein